MNYLSVKYNNLTINRINNNDILNRYCISYHKITREIWNKNQIQLETYGKKGKCEKIKSIKYRKREDNKMLKKQCKVLNIVKKKC